MFVAAVFVELVFDAVLFGILVFFGTDLEDNFIRAMNLKVKINQSMVWS